MKKSLLLASIIIFACSCSNDNNVEPTVQTKQATINASFSRGVDSRTALADPSANGGGEVNWVSGDKIGVFTDADEKNLLFTADAEGTTSAFTGAAYTGTPQYAYYPRANTNDIANPASFKLAGAQSNANFAQYDHRVSVGAFDESTNTFTFKSTLTLLKFRGIDKINILPKEAQVKELTIATIGDEPIQINGSYKYNRGAANPYYYVNNGSSSTTVTFNPALSTNDITAAAYVFVLPQISGNAFNVTLTTADATFDTHMLGKITIPVKARVKYKTTVVGGTMYNYDLSKVTKVWFNFGAYHNNVLGLFEAQKPLHNYFASLSSTDPDLDGDGKGYTKTEDGLDWVYLTVDNALRTAVGMWLQ